MNKKEILTEDKKEDKDKVKLEKEVTTQGGSYAAIVAAVLATIFFLVQIFLGGGMNYGLYAIVFSIPSTGFIFKAVKLKQKHEILIAIAYVISTIGFAAAHIAQLISNYNMQ